jgi:hypothetical protein
MSKRLTRSFFGGKKMRKSLLAMAAMSALALSVSARAAVYLGNGATGFGGSLGNGSLSITDDGTNITFTLNNAGGFNGNDVVVYIDSVAGGFADTSQLSDDGDGGRESVSGFNSSNPSRTLAVFPAGFGADYALEFENNTFDGLFQLVAGGNNTMNFVGGNSPTSPATNGPYVVTVPLSDLGITSGDSFSFVGTLISTTAYRSNETIGDSVTIPDPAGGSAPNAGFNGSTIFSSAEVYPAPAPEPASLVMVGGALALLAGRRRLA